MLLRALLPLLGCGTLWAAPPERPNIIFVLADDLGWTDLGCAGSRYYETPMVDRLAREGMRFTSFYVCQNCAPTRAALMSGQYAPRTGVYTVGSLERGRERDRKMIPPANETNLPRSVVTIADALRAAGYATGMFGKWHLGEGPGYHPSQRGFDEAIVAQGRHFGFRPNPPVEVPEGAYLADYLTDLSLRFIEKHRGGPFFLYIPHFAVHAPLQAKEAIAERFRAKPPAGGHKNPVYAAMVASLDEGVGRVLGKLDDLGLASRTVVIFASDNGGVGGYTAPSFEGRKGTTDNAPLRGGKGMLYEGGQRVPFIVRWTGVVKAGSVCDVPAAHVDLFPTLLEIAGARRPEGQVLDGVSLVPLLERGGSGPLARDAIYWHFPGYLESYIAEATWRTTPAGAIRRGDWKLLEFFEDGRVELYDLRADIGETRNLAAEMPEKARELRERLAAWRKSVGAAMPRPKDRASP